MRGHSTFAWVLTTAAVLSAILAGCRREMYTGPTPPAGSPTITPVPATSTYTRTASPTATRTPTLPAATFTFTNSRTPTVTGTLTPTFTMTSTPTVTSTSTVTPTGTVVPPTNTLTFTSTSTFTVTSTSTATATSTSTGTPTYTSTVTSTPTAGSGGCTTLENGFESLTENGSIAPQANVTVTITAGHATQGSNSLQANLGVAGSQNLITWSGFFHSTWASYSVTQIVMDVYVDPALVGPSYTQLQWVAQSSSSSKWWAPITANVDVVAGQQSVTFNIDYSQGNLLATDTISSLILVYNTDDTTGLGSFYVDNLKLVSVTCPPIKPSACGLVNGYETLADNGSTTAQANVTVSTAAAHATQGNDALQMVLGTAGSKNLITWSGLAPSVWASGGVTITDIICDVYVDPALVGASYTQLQWVAQSAASSKYWAPITANFDVVAGAQSVTFAVDWAQGNMLPTDVISSLILVYNTDNTTGLGTIVLDNVRFKNGLSCNP